MNSKTVGNEGESAAVVYLEANGFIIIDTNVRPMHGMRRGEIDIVAWHGNILCFIEVKTRISRKFDVTDAITVTKRRQLTCLAQAYIARHKLNSSECRFDVVCVYQGTATSPADIQLLPNAFDPVY